jgi:hypothetical protein
MHQPRSIRFIRREDLDGWRLKVYGIGTHAPDARDELVDATVGAAHEVLPDGGGEAFVIAHDAKGGCLALVYWWANENEIHLEDVLKRTDRDAYLAAQLPDTKLVTAGGRNRAFFNSPQPAHCA